MQNMSIPPLVCSTPPPPDQCEDDKDPEDFDIQYNLSQEDEDNYDFGSFSTYNHYQSSQSKTDPVTIKVVESPPLNESSKQIESSENELGTNTSESKPKYDEDTNVEDLDLKLDQETLKADITDSKESILEVKSGINDPIQDTYDLATDSNLDRPNDLPINLKPVDFVVEPPSLEQTEGTPSYVDEIIAAVDKLQMTPTVPELPADFPDVEYKDVINESKQGNNSEEILSEVGNTEMMVSKTELAKQIEDDDFGDFENFHFTAPIEKPITLDSSDNPWDNTTTDDDFGDFKANFNEGESSLFPATDVRIEHSNKTSGAEEIVQKSEPILSCVEPSISEEEDFGDFNDFQTSAENKSDLEQYVKELQKIPILNLEDSEEQFSATVNNILFEAFEDAIEEPVEEIEGKLESVLGETWGYLLAVDDRQPYMVNWNNSLGQKTLLKALCIDSRNILFGPKWNYNMPKYAATLSVAPLQPQKQVSSSTVQAEHLHQDKTTSKAPGDWSDPFASEGQESCNPETASQNPVVETGPNDRAGVEASTSKKPDKIFSSTLNVQPIRQISLPDTHIFTPTDSETPRSTTIHYDNSPTVLLPQTVIETSKSEPSYKSGPRPTSPQPGTSSADDDYWEFQNFKGSTSSKTHSGMCIAPEQPNKPNTSVTYGTQVLQPIKVEPIMPTLNWPDPGEVKETFDDFSDFVSSTSSSNQLTQTPSVPVVTKPSILPDLSGPSNTLTKPNERVAVTCGDFDDEFNTFQSALPSTSLTNFSTNEGSVTSVVSSSKTVISTQSGPPPVADFDYAFPKIENVKSEPISLENINKIPQNQINFYPSISEVKSTSLQSSKGPISSGLLQPIQATTVVQNQQKSGQILQPLSLESFSQINWPNPGIDLQDLSRFNPVETLHSLKSDLSVNSQNKVASPVHSQKSSASNQLADDDWGEFVSSVPKQPQQHMPKKVTTFADDEEWTDFVSSPSVKPQNGLNTISFNVHTNTNLTIQKPNPGKIKKSNQIQLDIPSLNYITPKSSKHKSYDRHLNL